MNSRRCGCLTPFKCGWAARVCVSRACSRLPSIVYKRPLTAGAGRAARFLLAHAELLGGVLDASLEALGAPGPMQP